MNEIHLSSIFKLKNSETGRPEQARLTPKQRKIFESIVYQVHPRVQVIAPTQYGKSDIVSMAVLLRALTHNENFIIIAPQQKKADIIMGYVIDHCFDHPMFYKQLEIDKENSLDRLRRERSKKRITFKRGGSIETLTLDAKNSIRNIEAAMGFGGNRLILDESGLVGDVLYSTVKRMLGGHKDGFLFEIGNPFYRNHFYKTWNSGRYYKIYIDYKVGLAEGRYTEEYIEEMREEALFDIFYECKFPNEDEIDARGYRLLVSMDLLQKSYLDTTLPKKNAIRGKMRLGVDVGGGGDYNVYVLRDDEKAWIVGMNRSNDTMVNVTEVERLMEEYGIEAENIYIDDVGIGRGVSDRLLEKGIEAQGISVGSASEESEKYANIKAEISWKAYEWIKKGGHLIKDDNFNQVNWIKYKINTDKAIKIEPKEDLRQRTGKSPDFADAFFLTFAENPMPMMV